MCTCSSCTGRRTCTCRCDAGPHFQGGCESTDSTFVLVILLAIILMTAEQFIHWKNPKTYFAKPCFPQNCISQTVFPETVFPKTVFPKPYFPKPYFPKLYFSNILCQKYFKTFSVEADFHTGVPKYQNSFTLSITIIFSDFQTCKGLLKPLC